MANFLILLRNDLNTYDYRMDLGGETFRLKFVWNIREERYHLSVYSEEDIPLCSTPLVLNNDLFGRFRPRVPELPQGTMYTARESGSLEEPLKADYGDDFKLFFNDEVL